MSKLLREYLNLEYDPKMIVEMKARNEPIVIPALLQRCDAENQNKRVYPRHILEREIENYKKAVMERRATGELDHPNNSVVELKNVSHIVRDIWWENNDVKGKIQLLNTPSGLIAQQLLADGVQIGVSSRGVGDVLPTNEGYDMVDENFMLICFDLVSEPSTQGAWLQEGKENVNYREVMKSLSKADRVNRIVNEILRRK